MAFASAFSNVHLTTFVTAPVNILVTAFATATENVHASVPMVDGVMVLIMVLGVVL